jgi:hypothetical protein
MGLIADPTCAACGIEEKLTLSLSNSAKSLMFGKPIQSVCKYDRFETHFYFIVDYGLRGFLPRHPSLIHIHPPNFIFVFERVFIKFLLI